MKPEILEALKYVLKLNPKLILSGSLALRLQSDILFPDREVGDLDFELPHGENFVSDEMLISEDYEGDEYFSDTHAMYILKYKNVKINLFQANLKKDQVQCVDQINIGDDFYVRLCGTFEILVKKLDIALSSGSGFKKHLDDVIQILNKYRDFTSK